MTIRETQIKITAIIRHPTDTRMAADRQTRYTQSKGRKGHAAYGRCRKESKVTLPPWVSAWQLLKKNSTNSPAKPSHRKNLPERNALSLIFIRLLRVKKPNSQTHVEWFGLFCSKTLDRPGKRKSQLKRCLSQIGPWSNFFTVD